MALYRKATPAEKEAQRKAAIEAALAPTPEAKAAMQGFFRACRQGVKDRALALAPAPAEPPKRAAALRQKKRKAIKASR